MPVPHLGAEALDIAGPAAVLIPLRSFRDGKLRLSPVLDADQRAAAMQTMAERVVAAAHDLPVLVVYDDADVARWATERELPTLKPIVPGLNQAVAAGSDALAHIGVGQVIVAHGDLPKARDLRVMLSDEPISIAPDRHGDGTNVLSVPTTPPFEFAYGPGSFSNHCAIARALDIEPRIVEAPDLAYDVDHPDDLLGLGLDQLLDQDST